MIFGLGDLPQSVALPVQQLEKIMGKPTIGHRNQLNEPILWFIYIVNEDGNFYTRLKDKTTFDLSSISFQHHLNPKLTIGEHHAKLNHHRQAKERFNISLLVLLICLVFCVRSWCRRGLLGGCRKTVPGLPGLRLGWI